jgi:hypothetical protein
VAQAFYTGAELALSQRPPVVPPNVDNVDISKTKKINDDGCC